MAPTRWFALLVAALPALCHGGGFSLGFGASEEMETNMSWAHEFSRRNDPLALALIQQDSPCTGPPSIGRDECLGKAASCMWMDLGSKKMCLPCEFGGIDIPCAPVKAMYGGLQVKDCIMSCNHQKILTKISECTDVSGSISTTECFQKGTTANGGDGEKCQWSSYVDKNGAGKSICGPCVVAGIGTIPCYNDGDIGPEGKGSSVTGCATQCDLGVNDLGIGCGGPAGDPVPAVPNCWPTPAPPPPDKGTIPLEVMKIHTRPDAPEYFAVAVDPPYGPRQYTEASAMAARAAGWDKPIPLPPDASVVIYGGPPPDGPTLPPTLKVMYGPPPPGIPGVPPPGYGYGTVPPAANVKAADAQAGFIQEPGPDPGLGAEASAVTPGPGFEPVVMVESEQSLQRGEPPLLRRKRSGGYALTQFGSGSDDEGPPQIPPTPMPIRTIQ